MNFILLVAVASGMPASSSFAADAAAATPSTARGFQLLQHRDQEWYGSTFWTGPDWTRVGKEPAKVQVRLARGRRPEALPEPPTERLSPESGRELVEAEWIHGRGDQPLAKAAEGELTRTQRILNRQAGGLDKTTVTRWQDQIDALKRELADTSANEVSVL